MYCHICYLEKGDGPTYKCGVCRNQICLECCSEVVRLNARCPFCRTPIDHNHQNIMLAIYNHTKDMCLTIALMITLFPEVYCD